MLFSGHVRGWKELKRIRSKASLTIMARTECSDRVIGAILRSWRYDISGITPEMRRDYEQHFVECARCRSRQKFHRSLDVTLAILTVLSMISFLSKQHRLPVF